MSAQTIAKYMSVTEDGYTSAFKLHGGLPMQLSVMVLSGSAEVEVQWSNDLCNWKKVQLFNISTGANGLSVSSALPAGHARVCVFIDSGPLVIGSIKVELMSLEAAASGKLPPPIPPI